MPFAVLLGFVDSLQEDRRFLDNININRPFLRSLTIANNRIVGVHVDTGALSSRDLLYKIVEANDVNLSVKCNSNSLEVRYPDWMIS